MPASLSDGLSSASFRSISVKTFVNTWSMQSNYARRVPTCPTKGVPRDIDRGHDLISIHAYDYPPTRFTLASRSGDNGRIGLGHP